LSSHCEEDHGFVGDDSNVSVISVKIESFKARVLELLTKENPLIFHHLVPTTRPRREAAKTFFDLLRKPLLLNSADKR